MNINVPQGWRKIDPKNYKKLGIVNNEKISCIGSYMYKDGEIPCLISYFDYSKNDESFLDELDKYYDEIEEMNELIDGDPSEEDYESTAILRSLFHGYIDDTKKIVYVNINKVLVDKGYRYMFQMFNKGNKGLYCVELNLNDVDDNNIINKMKKTKHVVEAVEILSKLAIGE